MLLLVLQGCEQTPMLDRLQNKGKLHVATVAGPLSCYLGETGAAGLEDELANAFAKDLGLTAEITVYPSRYQAVQAVKNGTEDMVANWYPSSTPLSGKQISSAWMHTQVKFVHFMGSKAYDPDKMPQTKLVVPKNTGVAQLVKQQHLLAQFLDISEEQLLKQINSGTYKYSLSSKAQIDTHRRFLPYLVSGKSLQSSLEMHWLFPGFYDDSLGEQANRFLQQIQANGYLKTLQDKYIHNLPKHDFVTRRDFWKQVESRLPKYLNLFKQAGKGTGIDWRLLAAIGYQESHWNEKATSPTGVRGIMMLTLDTAKQQNIKNRLDPKQSIIGGARHLLWMEQRIPSHIQGEDLLWFTLASYNIGYGHLEDARILTERAGQNPNSWESVKKHLPLLRQKKYYSTLKYGRARGNEPVTYVENIRYYYSLLVYWDNQQHGRNCSTGMNQTTTLRLRTPDHQTP